jgi:hypothetical protein
MDTALLIADLNHAYGWDLMPAGPQNTAPAAPQAAWSENVLATQLAEKINALIQRDFDALVQLLYRIDVPEQKLRRMLDDNSGEDAGLLIARLIMERQWQKIESRRKYRQGDTPGADEEERW